jgi:hypothetical protein
MTTATDDYADLLEGLRDAYEQPALDVLKRVSDACLDRGMVVRGDPFPMHDDDYRWVLVVWRDQAARDRAGDDELIDITLEVAEERSYDNQGDYGVNFGLTIVEYGGRVLGGLAPFNYTDQCWVDARDPVAVLERFDMIRHTDPYGVPEQILRES